MRMQEEKTKVLLCARALLLCCSSAELLSTNEKLWLKFLYLIFDKQGSEVEKYFQTNKEQLIQMCTSQQRLQRVSAFADVVIAPSRFVLESNLGDRSSVFDQGRSVLETVPPTGLSTCRARSLSHGDQARLRYYENTSWTAVRQDRDGNVRPLGETRRWFIAHCSYS